MPAWTLRRETTAWDVAVNVAAQTAVGVVAAAATVGGWEGN